MGRRDFEEGSQELEKWHGELEALKKFEIDRCLKLGGFDDVVKIELYGVADSSDAGIGERF